MQERGDFWLVLVLLALFQGCLAPMADGTTQPDTGASSR